MARLLLIDVENDEIKEVNIEEDNFNDYYKHLNCRIFDIARRKIGGKMFDIYVDDEGLLKSPQPSVSAYCLSRNEPMLVGNLIIANCDEVGNTTDLSDDDIKLIKENLIFATSFTKPNGYSLLACEY